MSTIDRIAWDAAYKRFRTNIVADLVLNLIVMVLCIFFWKMTWYLTILVFLGGTVLGQLSAFALHFYLNTRKLKRGEPL